MLSILITNRHSMARIGALDVDWPAVLVRLDLKGPRDKVAWIEKRPSQCLFFFYSAISRLARPHPGHVLVAISNQQVYPN